MESIISLEGTVVLCWFLLVVVEPAVYVRQLGLDTTDAFMADESDDEEIVEGVPVNPALDAWVVRSWRYGIASWTFQALRHCGAPPILLNLLF